MVKCMQKTQIILKGESDVIQDQLAKALSKQLNFEFYSAYLYLSMSSYCNRKGFVGFSNWLHVQSQEEMAHAMHMYQYILDRGAVPVLEEINKPLSDFDTMQLIFKEVLSHEQKVTDAINTLSTMAMQLNDHSAYQFLQWYVNEQVEEISSVDLIYQKLQHIGDNMALMFMMDSEMAARVFVDPFGPAARP